MKMKFIIVDDEEVIRDSLFKFIGQKGHGCKTASNGKEALKIIEKEGTDVVISGLVMPHMDAFELLKIIRNKYPNIKVIIFTAFASSELASIVKKYGVYGVCSKSDDLIKMSEIIQQIEKGI